MNYLELLFPDFSLILIGFLLCRYTALNRSVWGPVESLVYFCLFPTLLFSSIVKSPLDLHATSGLLAAGLLVGLAAIVLSYNLPRLPGLGRFMPGREHAASVQVAFRFNSFVALALADRLGGAHGLQMIAVLIGVCVPIYNIAAVWPMVRHAERGFLTEVLRNPLVVATLSGLTANLLGFTMPGWLEPTAQRIGSASLALGLMSAGAGMELGQLARARTLAASILAIRHLVSPLLALALSRLFGLDLLQSTVLLAFSALPTASTCYVLAARMGHNGPFVAGLVTASTLLGVASLPFALSLVR
ncbi:MAG: AEC family transporter [Curvibacter sp.]|nr:AEC family transporter [Curvibacter sp.]